MGTNYYIKKENVEVEISEDCDFHTHIGKSSGGWQFIFNPKFKTGQEWIRFIKENEENIMDEYGRKVSLKDMLSKISLDGFFGKDKATGKTVTEKEYGGRWQDHEFFDEDGYRISKSSEFS